MHMTYRRTMRELDYKTSVKLLKDHENQPINEHSEITIDQYLKAIKRLQLTVHSIGDVSPEVVAISQEQHRDFKKDYASGVQ